MKSIELWTSAFLKYLAIYAEKFPKLVPVVIKHCEIILELANKSGGSAWLNYDKQELRDIEARSIPWGQLHYEYWVTATTFRQPTNPRNFQKQKFPAKAPAPEKLLSLRLLLCTEVAAAHPSNVRLSTTALNVVSPTQSYTVDWSKTQRQKTTSQLNCRSSPLVPHPQAKISVVTPVRVSILQHSFFNHVMYMIVFVRGI
jgi:hypothetical protein